MNVHTRLEVIDRDGWRKEYTLQKNMIQIGSDSRNDVVLAREGGGGVAPRHAQLLYSAEGYLLVNLADTDILLGPSGDKPLPSRVYVDVADGEHIRIGDFTLVLGSSREAPSIVGEEVVSSDAIGLQLFLPRTELAPDQPIEGVVRVRNQGDKPGVQFKLEVQGLDPICYDIGPGPILFPNAEKEVFFHLRHPRGPRPPAGQYRFTIRATAEAYPGQSSAVSEVLRIVPFYSHELQLIIPG